LQTKLQSQPILKYMTLEEESRWVSYCVDNPSGPTPDLQNLQNVFNQGLLM